MDNAKANELKGRVETALSGMNNDTLKVAVSHGHFGANAVRFTVEISEVLSDGNVATQESEAFVQNAEQHGLKPSLIFNSFSTGVFGNADTSYKIIGFNTRSPKMPIILQGNRTKRRYKMDIESLKKLLERKEP
jgi:hypothetical protein